MMKTTINMSSAHIVHFAKRGSSKALKGFVLAATLLLPLQLAASGSGVALESPIIDTGNHKSLQRGAKTFVNYCMGCHTADYARYSRVAADLKLDEEDVLNNLIFTTDDEGERSKVGSLMESSMSEDYGKQAFGVAPPNLALTARSRGVDWIYSYLKGFYLDPSRPGLGVNNTVYPGAAMPHVLWEQQGLMKANYVTDEAGHKQLDGLSRVSDGTMSEDEYDDMVADLVNFMAYMADPIKQTRHRIGMVVMLFLLLLLALVYSLKKEYWKDVV
ncbi:MAG: cytochrome c1 [Granulosicoccaceae bacterium]